MNTFEPDSETLRNLLTPLLRTSSSPVELRKGLVLFSQHQRPSHLYLVAAGEVVLERSSSSGDLVVLQRVRKGLVAEASLQAESYHCSARVSVQGAALAIPINLLRQELAQDATFALRWIQMLNKEVRRLRTHCEPLSLRSVADRLFHLIETEGTDGRLQIGGGLKSLASELSVSHEALYRSLATLEKSGALRRGDGYVEVVQVRIDTC